MKNAKRILDLRTGDQTTVVGTITKKKRNTKEKKPYINLCLEDNSGKAYSMIWSDLDLFERIDKEFNDGDYCEVVVKVEKAQSKENLFTSVIISGIEKVERPGVRGVVDIEGLKNKLREKMAEITHPGIKELLINIFKREDVKSKFFTAPATEKSAYSFEGGLLAHTVRLIDLADVIVPVYNLWPFNIDGFIVKLNIDLLKACAILHDIGKILALQMNEDGKVEKTKDGQMFEDSYLTAKVILAEINNVDLLPDEKMLLEHAITSAKGKLAYGALSVPRTAEALAFHQLEKLDSDMGNFEFMERTAFSSDEFVKLFEKTYFLGEFEA